ANTNRMACGTLSGCWGFSAGRYFRSGSRGIGGTTGNPNCGACPHSTPWKAETNAAPGVSLLQCQKPSYGRMPDRMRWFTESVVWLDECNAAGASTNTLTLYMTYIVLCLRRLLQARCFPRKS